jgi:hypothetical protein
LEELRRRGDRSVHHISTTKGGQTRVFTVTHVYQDLAAKVVRERELNPHLLTGTSHSS